MGRAAALLGIAVLPALAVTVPAAAAPNWLGQTGLLRTPTADALNSGDWNASFHYITDVASVAAANVGLARGLEVGGVWYDQQNRRFSRFAASAKYRLISETPKGVGVAVGWWDVSNQVNSTLYGVVSKTLTQVSGHPLRGHIGYGGGVYRNNVFAGADLPLVPNLLAMLEYDGSDFNGGVRWGLPSGIRVDAGFVRQQLGIGASFNARF